MTKDSTTPMGSRPTTIEIEQWEQETKLIESNPETMRKHHAYCPYKKGICRGRLTGLGYTSDCLICLHHGAREQGEDKRL